MTNEEMASSDFRIAEQTLKQAESSLKDRTLRKDREASLYALRKDREASLYGDEMLDVPPDRIFGRLEADAALADARFVLEQCQKLVREHRRG